MSATAENTSNLRLTAFIDASLQGYGIVATPGAGLAGFVVLGAAWQPAEARLHINQLELLAFKKLLLALPLIKEKAALNTDDLEQKFDLVL